MVCHQCKTAAQRYGKDRNGNQRYRCMACKKTFIVTDAKPLGTMRIDQRDAVFALRLLLEGTSVRAVERLTGLHRDTICDLVATVGRNCQRFLDAKIRDVKVEDVQCDEVWGFVGCKEKTRQLLGHDMSMGDAYCFTAIERNTKLLVAWHLGKRSNEDNWEFLNKLYFATSRNRFQLSTDGYTPYGNSVPLVFQFGVDFSQLIKKYGGSSDRSATARYSPAQIIGVEKTHGCGNPDMDRVCTSHVERSNLTMRMQIRRMTRLTNAHSKKWTNHEAMLALFFAWYNFVRVHSTIKTTPAVAHGLTDHE